MRASRVQKHPPDFSRISRFYGFLERLVFGNRLAASRQEFRSTIGRGRRVLVLGDGDGRGLKHVCLGRLQRTQDPLEIEFVDCSPGMIARAKTELAHLGGDVQIRFRCEDARNATFKGPFDVVVTHFFLDCLSDAEVLSLVGKVAGTCLPGCSWIVSEFAVPERSSLRLGAGCLIRVMYAFFQVTAGLQVTAIPDYASVLQAHGFRLNECRLRASGLLRSERWEKA